LGTAVLVADRLT